MENNNNKQNDTRVRYDIGTKEGNDYAFERIGNIVNGICEELDIEISNSSYFTPKSDDFYTIHELLLFRNEVKELKISKKIKYYIRLIDNLISLQKNRVIFPSSNSKFYGYHLDTLFFLKEKSFPLYKDNHLNKIKRPNYVSHFYLEGQKILKEILQIDQTVGGIMNIINAKLKELANINGIKSIDMAFKKADEGLENCKKFKSLMIEKVKQLEGYIEDLCDKLSTEPECKTVKSRAEVTDLFYKLTNIAIVGMSKALNVRGQLKIKDYPESKKSYILPFIHVLDKKTNCWLQLSSELPNFISVASDLTLTVKQAKDMQESVFVSLINDEDDGYVLTFKPFVIPFRNGNYDVLTKEFNSNPDPMLEPVPARMKIRYNRDADYKNYTKIGVNPLDFLTSPFTRGDYSPSEIEKRKIYAGHVITDILTPFDRSIGDDSVYWITGDGGSGKTTYIEMLKSIVGGGQAKSVDVSSLDNQRFELGNIAGIYLLLGNEATDSGSMGVKTLKQVGTGDELGSEEKHEQKQTVHPTCSVVINSNGNPSLQEDGGATQRRFRIIPFNYVFDNATIPDNFKGKDNKKVVKEIRPIVLQDDHFLECIVNYALDMAEEHAIRTEHTVTLPVPDSVMADTKAAIKHNDTLSEFAEFLGNRLPKPVGLHIDHFYPIYEVFTKVIGKEKYAKGKNAFVQYFTSNDNIKRISRNETFEFDGEIYRQQVRMTKSKIMEIQLDIVNNMTGSQELGAEAHIRNKSNSIAPKSKPYDVVWALPFKDEPLTTEEIFEEKKEKGEPILEEDIPF